MNFRPELAEKVMAGEKTVTRRLVSDKPTSHYFRGGCSYEPYGGPGGGYSVCPGRGRGAIGRIVVTDVRLEALGYLTDAEARLEGFSDAGKFEAAFTEINGRYDPSVEVWRIEFEPVREEAEDGH